MASSKNPANSSSVDARPRLLGSASSGTGETAPRVLIVDDEESVRSLLYDLLCDSYHCEVAVSAEEALTLVDRAPFDVILSDIHRCPA